MNHKSIKVVLFILTMVLSLAKGFAADLKYGYIESISSSDNASIYLIRKDKQIPVEIGMNIYTKDKLELKGENIEVKYCNNAGTCMSTNKGMLFSNEGVPITEFDLVMSWLNSKIGEESGVKLIVKQAVSRNSGDTNLAKYPPAIYLAAMTEVSQSIFLGNRSLVFQWRNGAPPFTVKVVQGEKLLFSGKTTQQYINTSQLNLTPDEEYQVSIIDKNEKSVSASFNVIKKPQIAKELTSFLKNGGNSLSEYTRLGTIAIVDGGQYALEAYQQLLPISSQSSALMSLQKAIETGDAFPEIKSEVVIHRLH